MRKEAIEDVSVFWPDTRELTAYATWWGYWTR